MNYKKLKFEKFSWNEKTECELKSGMVLKMKDRKYLLVGDVNRNMGVCDDCTNYELKDIREIAFLPGFEIGESDKG